MYTVSMPAKDSPNHGFSKRAGFHSCRLFLLCIFFGLKPTCTISPQCLHFISSTTFPGGISSMSKMRRPHLGFGHFTFSIDNRLPALICNKGNQPVSASSLLSFVLYVMNRGVTYLKIPKTSSTPCSPSNHHSGTMIP